MIIFMKVMDFTSSTGGGNDLGYHNLKCVGGDCGVHLHHLLVLRECSVRVVYRYIVILDLLQECTKV